MRFARPFLPLLLASLAAACGHPQRPISLVVLTLDTTRADRLGCYGRADAGTPHLDGLAARGARFERAYTPAPITLPAHAALFTGTGPRFNGVHDNAQYRVDERLTTLAEALAARGYRTGAVVGGYPLLAAFGLAQGFDYYDDVLDARSAEGLERRAEEVSASAAGWLGTIAPDEPFFLWAHYFDPHWPYAAPEPWASRHADPYQAEIAYTDACIGRVLEQLERDGRLDDTVVVAIADHGEGLGEHGEQTHSMLIYDGTLRVPFLLAGPGVPAGVVVEDDVLATDVLPTVAELCDFPVPADARGASLVPATRGEDLPPRPLYVESWFLRLHHGWSELEGVVHDGWKLVEAPRAGPERDLLYDLNTDPRELSDRAAEEPERLQRLRAALDALRAEQTPDAPFAAARALDDADLDALAELGYGGYAEAPESPEDGDPSAVHPHDRVRAATLFTMAKAAIQRGLVDEAEPLLAELEAEDPGGVGTLFLRALALTERGRSDPAALEGAIDAYRAALALAPSRTPIWRNRAEAHFLRGEVLDGLVALRTAQRLSPALAALRTDLDRAVRQAERMLVAGELELDPVRERLLIELLLGEMGSSSAALEARLEALGG